MRRRWFWAWERIDCISARPYRMYYLGVFYLTWSAVGGWKWGGWNLD